MDEFTEQLARAKRTFPVPDLPVDAVYRRRDRRGRRRRATAAGSALIVGLLVITPLLVANNARNAQESAEQIVPTNVSRLGLLWSSRLPVASSAPVVVDGDQVFVVSPGQLSVFSTSCTSSCAPLWSATLPGPHPYSWWGGVAVSGGRVYVGSASGVVLGFPTSCSGECRPTWRARASGPTASASPVISGGRLYVGVDRGAGSGSLQAFSTSCSTSPCRPVWSGNLSAGFLGATPVVARDSVFIGSSDGTLQAFPITCHGRCTPRWTASLGSGSSPSNLGDMQTPLVERGDELFAASGSRVSVFSTSCTPAGGTCDPLWVGADLLSPIVNLAVSDGHVFASTFAHSTAVYSTDCRATPCAPAWTLPDVVAELEQDGVLYAATAGRAIQAFAEACGDAGGACASLWSGPFSCSMDAPPAVIDGKLYVASDHLCVFALTGSPVPASSSAQAP